MPDLPSTDEASRGASGQLVDSLVEKGVLSEDQADQIRRRVRRTGVPITQAILNLGYVSEEQVYRTLADNAGLDFVDLSEIKPNDAAVEQTPAKVAFHYKMIPIERTRSALRAAARTCASSLAFASSR